MNLEDTKKLYNPSNKTGMGIYTPYDWNRLEFVSKLPIGGNIIDIGCGNGSLLHLLGENKNINSLTGLDIRQNLGLKLPDGADYKLENILHLSYKEDQFDTVICMEVLEHLEKEDLDKAISNLRYIAKSLNIYTVPFDEPEPVWWHNKPGGHRQSFNENKIRTLFPNSITTILKNYSVHWILICESQSNPFNGYKHLSNDEFHKALTKF